MRRLMIFSVLTVTVAALGLVAACSTQAPDVADAAVSAPDAADGLDRDAGRTDGTDAGEPDTGGSEPHDAGAVDGGAPEDADGGDLEPDAGEVPDAATGLRGFGEECQGDAECASGVCFLFGNGSKLCTQHCATPSECPVGSEGQKCNKQGVCKP